MRGLGTFLLEGREFVMYPAKTKRELKNGRAQDKKRHAVVLV
jgi:hypothetical protein